MWNSHKWQNAAVYFTGFSSFTWRPDTTHCNTAMLTLTEHCISNNSINVRKHIRFSTVFNTSGLSVHVYLWPLWTMESFMEIGPYVFPKSRRQTHTQTDGATLYIYRSINNKQEILHTFNSWGIQLLSGGTLASQYLRIIGFRFFWNSVRIRYCCISDEISGRNRIVWCTIC